MDLRDELYEEAMNARKNIRLKLVEDFLLKKLHESAGNGDMSCKIGFYTKLEDGKGITESEILSFAAENNLDYDFENVPTRGRWHILSYNKKD